MRRNPENCRGRIIIDDARVVEKKGGNGEKLKLNWLIEQGYKTWVAYKGPNGEVLWRKLGKKFKVNIGEEE